MSQLVFGVHCHQPIGNFDYVFEEAYEKAYKPLLEFFYQHEHFKFSVHFSGILSEWISTNKKDFIKKMKHMSEKGQMEVIGGGYYEPILATIPKKDRVLQIKKLNDFCYELIGQKPKGIWLTERIWNTAVLQTLIEMDMDYIIIDDYHIISSGYDFEEGFYFTEDEGKVVNLVPIDKRLRYKIPFEEPQKVVDFIKSQKTSIIVDDGEKFGIWPHTYQTVYEERWLERFLRLLEQENIPTKTISQALKENPKKLVYPASISYEEMEHWSLNYKDGISYNEARKHCKDYEKFIKGGIWKNFFTKYEESNYMHKRMLELSKKSSKKEHILKAQCNDAYWHGIFGGIYFPHLRRAIWDNIIKQDFSLGDFELLKEDIDLDGTDEIKLKTKGFILVASEKGTIKELSKKDIGNLNVCLRRHREFYHFIQEDKNQENTHKTIHELKKDISKYKNYLTYDDRPRFFSYDDMMWELSNYNDRFIAFKSGENQKILKIGNKFIIEYKLQKSTKVDINLGIHSLDIKDEDLNTDHISFEAPEIGKVDIVFSKSLNTRIYPAKTVSQSEKDFDLITQGICISFEAGGELSVEISC